MFRFTRRENSAKIGRPILDNMDQSAQYRIIHFGSKKQSITSPASQTDSLVKNVEEHHSITKTYPQRTRSTSLSRLNHDQHKPLTVIMNKANETIYTSLSRTPDLLKKYSKGKRRPLILTGPQITL